ncbi:MAG TPA: Crp/Fnr family transcriptional regulator [Chloroflexota bacterium]|jgi:CRP-like cAMP-binding protein
MDTNQPELPDLATGPPSAQGPMDTPREREEPAAAWRDDLIGALNTSDPPEITPSGGPLLGDQWSDAVLPRENRLLAALPRESYGRLRPKLEQVALRLKDILWEKDAPITHVYFPLNGVISMISIMDDGAAVEVGTVGNEGLVGVPVVLGATRTPLRAFAQVPGVALRMRSDDLRDELNDNPPLRDLLQRYTQALFVMLAQASACNRAHATSQRMALWLLMCLDRVGADTFPLTQEFLAMMLGVRRATVTQEAGRFQEMGAIAYHRGILTVTDRPLLEAACECYGLIRREYERLLGPAGPPWRDADRLVPRERG